MIVHFKVHMHVLCLILPLFINLLRLFYSMPHDDDDECAGDTDCRVFPLVYVKRTSPYSHGRLSCHSSHKTTAYLAGNYV